VNLIVNPSGIANWNGQRYRCALGSGGISNQKQEGDGITPAGKFPLRQVFFRPDRIERPHTFLPVSALTEKDGWSDDLDDLHYNQKITLPYTASHELLWRTDAVYDLIAVIGYNDKPVVSGCGSAIFLHLAKPDYRDTQGCVAFALCDLSRILNEWEKTSLLDIRTEA
jgi:L,D-peptidoglycan transpeptidase YkuD (ErfK/YbiS/YcfS/YnhG family)